MEDQSSPSQQSENSSQSAAESEFRSRKRKKDPTQWKKNIQKESRQRGRSYQRDHGPAKGTIAAAKVCPLGTELCHENCRLDCSAKIPDNARQIIFDYYYSIDQSGKDAYLSKCIESKTPDRKRKGAAKHHAFSYAYKVSVGGQQHYICKTALGNLLCIGRKVLDRVKKSVSDCPGPSNSNQSRRHSNRPNKIIDSRQAMVIDHIASYPAESSHYSRQKNGNRKYLAATLSVAEMYRQYASKCQDQNEEPVSEKYYRDIFNTKFNLGFGSPRSDVCAKCCSGEMDETHESCYHKASEEMKSDRSKAREGSGPIYITFDLQQTMPLPKVVASEAFYLRQLWFYNFGVHLVTNVGENGFMQTWMENEGGRGSNEICSGLLAFLEVAKESLSYSNSLVAWSDSCSGQNKNFTMVAFWQYVLLTKQFNLIDHKFPEIGHSYMDSDRDFGLIEKRLRKVEQVFSGSEYRELIKKAKVNDPFIVQDISKGMVDAKQLVQALKLMNKKRTLGMEKVEFRNIKWFRFEKFGFYKYKMSFDENEPWKEVDIRGRQFTSEVSIDIAESRFSLPGQRAVQAAKVADIQKLLKYVPRIHQQFFRQLAATTEEGSIASDENSGSDE